MVQLLGFESHEETLVTDMIAQFALDNYVMTELRRVEKLDLPGYNGKVVPTRIGMSKDIEMTMMLSCLSPFTVAHELAHVSDISTRRQETLDNLSLDMPTSWHLAHRMSSEYYANRIACDYSEEHHIFQAFQNDMAGLRMSVQDGEWASTLIHYALLLGIMHGMKRMDCDPIKLLGAAMNLPDAVMAGIEGFRHQSEMFFDGYGAPLAQAA
ncbi:MAG: hypothetical protein H7Z12_20320 [Rhodospirillaceae bacterium]|nr:hypothetical protein [Rhodospirillales bacterium]